MKKQEIAAKIWSGANALRGKVSAAKYKDYMLSLIFYKYLSNAEIKYAESQYYEEEDIKNLKVENTRDVEQMQNNLGYFIPYEYLFSTWVNDDDFSIDILSKALSFFNNHLASTHKKLFEDIFNTLETGLNDLGSDDTARSKALRDLIKIINDIPTEGREDYDVLGFIYEFLLKNFAANAGKAGEFYTPYEASEIMSEIIASHLVGRENISIYDGCSGSGSLLINIGKSVAKRTGDPNKIMYYAQELIKETFNLTKMNLLMRNVSPSNIVARCGDTLADDWPFFDDNDRENSYRHVQVDAIADNPPYSATWEQKSGARFDEYGLAPKGKADYAFLLHSLYHLKADGIMTIVLPHGVLFRGGEEGEIRKNLIKKHNIETIIGLPANCFFGTGIPVIIMVLKKERSSNDVLFVDASRNYIKDGNKNKLRAMDIRKIVDTVLERKTISNFSRLVSYEEIESNEFNLNIPRYVDSSVKENGYDLYALMNGGIPNKELESLDRFWASFPGLKDELFEPLNNRYSAIKNSDVKKTINENNDVVNYRKKFKETLKDLPVYLKDSLISKMDDVNILEEEEKISSKARELINDYQLIDYYDVYEIIDSSWRTISFDLSTLQNEGLQTINEIEEISQWVKDSKSKKMIEKTISEEGKILPFALIQEKYFANLKNEIKNLEEEISGDTSERIELLDGIDPNDKSELLKDNSEDIEAKKLNKKISEIKKKIKAGAEYEDGSYEDTILKIGNIAGKISSNNKKLKAKKSLIEVETREKIKTISKEDAFELLEEKWINPLYSKILALFDASLSELNSRIKSIEKKYDTTLEYLDNEIENTETELFGLLEELDGDDFELAGIKKLQESIKRGV